jgi:transketolase
MTKIDMRDAFFEKLVEAARLDARIIVLSADHGAFALKKFEEEMPDRYINIGIAEQNMVGVAAGLAASGKIVFIYGISPFVSLRVLEQLTIDVAAMQLPVNVVSVGAGFTYSTDGPTHQGLQDISAIATIPGMTIFNSSDPVNTRAFVEMAISSKRPHYIRIEKEKFPEFPRENDGAASLKAGFSRFGSSESNLVIITSGITGQIVFPHLEKWAQEFDTSTSLIDIHRIKPFPDLLNQLNGHSYIVVVDEVYQSTIGANITSLMLKNQVGQRLLIAENGENFQFVGSTRESMADISGLSAIKLAKKISKFLKDK